MKEANLKRLGLKKEGKTGQIWFWTRQPEDASGVSALTTMVAEARGSLFNGSYINPPSGTPAKLQINTGNSIYADSTEPR